MRRITGPTERRWRTHKSAEAPRDGEIMIRIRRKLDSTELADISYAISSEFERPEILKSIHTGDRVAVCVGSRGICRIDEITHCAIQELKKHGANPFIVPAMGSHGGATAEGQTEVLASYGITEMSMGAPIQASMETVFLGHTDDLHIPVYLSKAAYDADWIMPINRVKAHTDFYGPIESGLNKMITIGLGKERGCTALHRCGTSRFAQIIPEASEKVLATGKVHFGLAVIENGYDRTAMIRAVPGHNFLTEEPALLQRAKALMPSLPFRSIDVLIVEDFGKDISGSGMDPNITGRMSNGIKEGYIGPEIQRIVVLNLTEASHGNAIALNAADFITRHVFDQIDLKATYRNSMACCNPVSGQIPIIAETEKDAIEMAVASCRDINFSKPRIIRIKNTLALSEMQISEGLIEDAKNDSSIEFLA